MSRQQQQLLQQQQQQRASGHWHGSETRVTKHHHHHHHRDGRGSSRPVYDGGAGGYPQQPGSDGSAYNPDYAQYLALKSKFEQQAPQLPLANNTNANTVYLDDFGFPVQPQQQQLQLAMAPMSDYAEFEEGYNAPVNNQPYQQQQQQQQPQQPLINTPYSHFERLTDEEFLQPANVKYSKATFEANRKISGAMMIDQQTNRLRNNGAIIFSMENGHLRAISATYKPDFASLMAGANNTNNALSLTAQKNQQALNAKTRNDLVKSITVTMSSTYRDRLLISFPTVAAIGNEMFRNGADHVNYTIPAGVFADGKSYTFTVLDREIPAGVLAFTSVFDSAAPDTMDSQIVDTGRGYSLVPYNHAIVHYYNKEHEDDGLAITEESLQENLGNDVQMDTETVNRLLAVAKKAVSKNISLGNVTTDMKVRLDAIAPSDYTTKLERAQQQAKLTGNKALLDTVVPFMALADTHYTIGSNATQQQKLDHINRMHTFDISVSCEYLKIDPNRPIELLSSK